MWHSSNTDAEQGETMPSHDRGTVYTRVRSATNLLQPVQVFVCAERSGRDPLLGPFWFDADTGFILWLLGFLERRFVPTGNCVTDANLDCLQKKYASGRQQKNLKWF